MVSDAQRAIMGSDEAALRDAIRRGADVNGMATGARYTLLSLAAARALPGMCEILLTEGADTNMQGPIDGEVALHLAAHCGNTACICLLLRAGADVNARANSGTTPLHRASQYGRVPAAKLLIAAGASLEARTKSGSTPLRFAIIKGRREVALTLLRAGAAVAALRVEWIKTENKALHNYMIDIIYDGGWNARVERHRRPLMSILSNLALPHDALHVILSFWSPPGGR